MKNYSLKLKIIIFVGILLGLFGFVRISQAGSCTTLKDQNNESKGQRTYYVSLGSASSNVMLAQQFTVGSGYSICSIGLLMSTLNASTTMNVTAYLYIDDGGNPSHPGTVLAASTNSINFTGSGPGYNYRWFYFPGVSITQGTKYWIAVKTDKMDAANYLAWGTNGAAIGRLDKADAAASWTNISTAASGMFAIMTNQPGNIIFQDDFEKDPSNWACRDVSKTYPWKALTNWSGILMSCGWDDNFGALWKMGSGHNSNNAVYAWRYGTHLSYESGMDHWLGTGGMFNTLPPDVGDIDLGSDFYQRWYMKMPLAGQLDHNQSACGGTKLWRYNLREYGYQPYNPEIYLNFWGWDKLSTSVLALLTSTSLTTPPTSLKFPLKPTSEFSDGNWHSHEVRIKLNSPGNYDGIIQYWFDGVLIKNYTDINFGFDDAHPLKIHKFGVGLGNTCWGAGEPWLQTEWSAVAFDDVVVSTNYIGPVETPPDTTPPAAPTGVTIQ